MFTLRQSHPQATLKPYGSQPVATQKPPSGYPEATLRLPRGYPGATPSGLNIQHPTTNIQWGRRGGRGRGTYPTRGGCVKTTRPRPQTDAGSEATMRCCWRSGPGSRIWTRGFRPRFYTPGRLIGRARLAAASPDTPRSTSDSRSEVLRCGSGEGPAGGSEG